MKSGDICFVDTNVLLSATDEARTDHLASSDVFRRATAFGVHLAISGQVIREYLAVATRRIERNGFGLSVSDALHNVGAFRGRTVVLEEVEAVSEELQSLVRQFQVSGSQVHDANVVATMIVHRVDVLVTANRDDFSRYSTIRTVAPDEVFA